MKLSENIKSIEYDALSHSSELESVKIPESVSEISGYAFSAIPWFREKQKESPLVIINNLLVSGQSCSGGVVIPNGVKVICSEAFYGCSKLSTITFPNTINEVGGDAFNGTQWLEDRRQENPLVILNNVLVDGQTCAGDVAIPDNITSISKYAFYRNSTITSVFIPKSVILIGSDAFHICNNLSAITIENPTCKINNFTNVGSSGSYVGENHYKGIIYGYAGSTAQKFAEKYGNTFNLIENSSLVEGDCNNDGEFNIADIITLQRWLLNDGTKLANWKNVDLCKDNRIDVFALVLLKRMLISKSSLSAQQRV